MQIHIHIHHHGKPSDDEVLHNIFTLTKSIHTKLNEMSPEVQRITQEVAELKTVNQSAVALLQSLSQLIRDNIDDKAALTQLANDIDAETNTLADAVTANTPAAPVDGGTGTDTGSGPEGGGGNDNTGSNL